MTRGIFSGRRRLFWAVRERMAAQVMQRLGIGRSSYEIITQRKNMEKFKKSG